jgi:hypothetical protein
LDEEQFFPTGLSDFSNNKENQSSYSQDTTLTVTEKQRSYRQNLRKNALPLKLLEPFVFFTSREYLPMLEISVTFLSIDNASIIGI